MLNYVCDKIKNRVPKVRSIILIGSRATGSADEHASDFDIIVVLQFILIPFFYFRLKKIENEMSKCFGLKFSINPCPAFKVRAARDNYFLFKLAQHGIILWGEDIRRHIKDGGPLITNDVLLSFLSFLAKELIKAADSLFRGLREIKHREVLYREVKVLLGCAEVSLLMQGTCEDIPSKVQELLETDKYTLDQYLAKDLTEAVRRRSSRNLEATELWFRAQNHVLNLLRKILRRMYNGGSYDNAIGELVLHYVQKSRVSVLRNLQYLLLSVLNKKKVNLHLVFTTKMITAILYASAIMLLASIKRDGVDEESLRIACKLLGLNGYELHGISPVELLLMLRNYIIQIWEMVDVHMGF